MKYLTRVIISMSLLLAIVTIGACGTAKTVAMNDTDPVFISHAGEKSRCGDIPRLYSGVAYNVCMLNTASGPIMEAANLAENRASFILIDTLACMVTDTVALPWTIYTQSTRGNIRVNE